MLKPIIFISAVSRELKTSRQIVANTLQAIGFEPVWQDVFDLSADEIPAMLRKKIDRSSAVLQIVGDAFGGECSEVPADSPFARCSYTQYEALYAKSVRKPVYYLIATPELPRDLSKEELEQEDEEERRLQADYKRAVQTGTTIYYSVDSHDATENKIHRLRDKLDELRRGFWRALTIGGAGIAALIAIGLVTIYIVISYGESSRAQLQDMAEVLEKLPQRYADQSFGGQADTPEARLAAAYDSLEKEYSLPAGTLAAKLPHVAQEVLAGERVDPLARQAALFALGRYDEAEALGVEIADGKLASARNAETEAGKRARTQSAIDALITSGNAAEADFRMNDALRHYRTAATLTDRQADPQTWADTNYWVALALENEGRYPEAVEMAEKVVSTHSEFAGATSFAALRSKNVLATAYKRMGHGDRAVPLFEEIEAALRRDYGTAFQGTRTAISNLAWAYSGVDRHDEAIVLHEEVLKLKTAEFGRSDVRTYMTMSNLAASYYHKGRTGEALDLLEEAHDGLTALLPESDRNVQDVMHNLAAVYAASDRRQEGIELFERTLQIRSETLGRGHPDTLDTMCELASAYHAAGRTHDAILLLEEAVTLSKDRPGWDHPESVAMAQILALDYVIEGKESEGLKILEDALRRCRAKLGDRHDRTISVAESLATVYESVGRMEDAEKARALVSENPREPAATFP